MDRMLNAVTFGPKTGERLCLSSLIGAVQDEDRGTYDEDVYWGMELWDAARRDIILRRGAGKMQRCVNTLAFKKE